VPWFKVDDKLHDHRKSRVAKKAAMGVWVLAGSWCMDNLTDGFVPLDVLGRWGTKSDAQALVRAGLWLDASRNGEKGFQFHDWDRFQPSAAVTAAVKAKEAEAGLRGNHKRWHSDRGITDPMCEYCHRVPDQEPDWVRDEPPEGVPESPPNRPRPDIAPESPVPVPNTEPKGSGGDGVQALVGEWLSHCNERPPAAVIGQVSKHLKAMIEEGIRPEVVRLGLANWSQKALHPATLPSLVHEAQQRSGPQVRTFADGSVDPASLPPVEESWMRRRPKA
jgi:hypothetical protein